MKLKRFNGVFVDERGHEYLVPLKLNAVKKINGKVIEASVLLRMVEGVKKVTDKFRKLEIDE